MEKIILFFKSFIEEEYELLTAFYNTDLSFMDYNRKRDEFGKYFHSIMNDYEKRFYSRDELFDEEPEIFLSEKEYLLKRELFKVEKYKHPKYGKQLASNINADVIYRGFFGPIQKTTSPDLRFSNAFFAAEMEDSFKIIYEEFFNVGKWERPHDHDPLYIIDFGELVETKKFQAPEEELSLADYNAVG